MLHGGCLTKAATSSAYGTCQLYDCAALAEPSFCLVSVGTVTLEVAVDKTSLRRMTMQVQN